ncbi:MAG: ABC transporter permease [Anaerolineae bacterium]|nr:ABC transporter permease [Anaerolineae bacterium]NUQ06614.1 ABC transporter permease [Anaerolineae bacterium]
MTRYILGRTAALIFVMLAASAIVFVLMNNIPGGPFSLGERGYSPDALANLERKYGLDKPLLERYVNFVVGAVQFDFGYSTAVAGSPPVIDVILRTWPVTLQVGVYTIVLAFGLGLVMGTFAAYHRNSPLDNFITFTATLGIVLPNFIIATFLLFIFGFQNGWGEPNKIIIGPLTPGGMPVLGWDYFLPVITYALAPMALVARYTRAAVSEALGADYLRTARAKGLTDRTIMVRHVFRNAMIPLLTVLLPQIPNLLTGSLFIEVVYGIPGLGKFFVTSILNRDYPMTMALILLIAFFWGLTYLITDILYMVVDPRVRLTSSRAR